jgi:hypothetical protein
MKTGISIVLATIGLTAISAAHSSQSSVEGSARQQSNTAVSADNARANASQASRSAGQVQAGENAMSFDEGTEFNAELTRRVDARRVKPGDEVQAELTEEVRATNGATLPKGTRLVGRVTEVRPQGDAQGNARTAAESQMGILFEKAIVGRNQEVPINASIQALAASQSQIQSAADFGSSQPSRDYGRGSSRSTGGASGSLGGIGGAAGGVGGVAGGFGGVAGAGISGATRSTGGAAGSASGTTGSVSGAASSRVSGAVSAAGSVRRSSNAMGGVTSAGRLSSGSRGVFGMEGLEIASRSTSSAAATGRASATQPVSAAAGAAGRAGISTSTSSGQATVITSATGNVRLDKGTQMLLVANGRASASASASR